MSSPAETRVRFEVDDDALTRLHARIRSFIDDELGGFVPACWDGGSHAFALDTVVDPQHSREGIGRQSVESLAAEVALTGCQRLHLDYEEHLEPFYTAACGFRRTTAG